MPARTAIAADLTPSSLTQRGSRTAHACPTCGSNRVTVLGMTLTDGTPAQFVSCHTCEARHWSTDGHALAFNDVIARTTKLK